MSNFLRIIIGVLLFISTNSLADSSDKFYIKTGVNLNRTLSSDIKYRDDDGYSDNLGMGAKNYGSFTLGVGYKITSFYNIEALFQYTPEFKFRDELMNIEHSALILNNIISIPELIDAKWPIKPYVGLGLGFARYDFNIKYPEHLDAIDDYVNVNAKNSGTNFVWKATVGAVYPITKSIDLDLSYSYGDYGNLKSKRFSKEYETTDRFSYDLKANELFLGLRYKF
ncbi:outer membrane beta-barrel protein [Malaciobacter mytili]|uniref:outer membrane beta-barrel protein n=1 Tax=Malaciobacter mytili TaxID=603050 RepID=UPI003BB0CB11